MTTDKPTLEQQGFDRVGQISQAVGHRGAPLMDRIFGRWLGTPADRDWVVDAEWGRIQQEPVHARRLLYIMALALVALLVWSANAPLDEVARGDGRVIPSRQLQIVQSLDGGIVEEILVREGQIVEQGDLLLRIDPTRAVSSLRESRAQFLSLTAEVARLQALIGNLDEPDFPVDLVLEAPDIVNHERNTFFTNREELNEQISIYRRQLEQREQDLREARAARSQYASSLALSSRELQVTRPLLQSGAVSDVDIIRLEREVSNARGEVNRADASISRSEAAIEEARNKIREVELTVRNRWNAQLSESRARLNALTQAESGLEDLVRQTEIRAPVRGTVQRLFTNTVGGVVTPGREVLEIIPLDDQLIIEARIPPKDIAFIRPGQQAVIKFTAYDFAIFGGLDAEVEHISADTITDERDNTYYLVRLRTYESGFADDLTIIPGMTTQVDILTGKKTVLEYLMKPVLRATSQAMSER
ncbi:MAG: HlyD family type I secretion periplasmic adaptor subunit [Nitrincola lacisaponensis]|uniref:Membrane fusion protein (MFP) family protein n=1 Tax=Nitrincola lacisaponensis TaxID=267850 RepID=A0A063Y3V7_9GAMM|nr:HlyD family type I secretion periplasmic adaptor subunit [Nitrincola lacisaponensis]KDE39217.1 Type I secretion system, membrane fusion protein LapC [Nitrincola lacisaponensis]